MTLTGQSAARDPLAVLEEIRERAEHVQAVEMDEAGAGPKLHEDVLRLLAMLDAALKPHAAVQIYGSGDECGHDRPGGDGGEAEEWEENHPYGTTPADDAVRICMLSPDYTACRACTELVYQTWGDDDRFVRTEECTVRPAVVAAAVSGEEVPS